MWQCSQHHDNKEEAKFCSKCGEKRITDVYCIECGILLAPDDLFCTSCGHRRDADPKPVSTPQVATRTPVAATPVETPAPTPQPTVVAAPSNPAPEEPVTFHFGGRVINMNEDPKRVEAAPKIAPIAANMPPGAHRGRMSPMQSMILGFLVSAVVLGLAFYLTIR